MKNILIVPSFMADTYSNIEDIYIRMSRDLKGSYNFIWLVRDTKSRYERYKNPDLKGRLDKALFVKELEKNDIQYITADIDKYNIISNYFLFKDIFDKYSIDAVYTHFNFEKYWTALFAKLFSKKIFYNEHMYFGGPSRSRKTEALKKTRTAFINHFSDRIIAVSGFIAKDFDKGKTTVLYNAIDINQLIVSSEEAKIDGQTEKSVKDMPRIEGKDKQGSNNKNTDIKNVLRKELGLDPEGFFVIMAAAFRPIKDHYAAVDIVKKTLEKRPEIKFVFAGDGELLVSVKNLCQDLGIYQSMIFTGHTNRIDDYYRAADVAMLTSQVEPFGYTVIEAMASMLPLVVFSDTGGPDEIITDSEDGFLVKDRNNEEFSNIIIRLADDENMRRNIGLNARKTVIERFSYNRWIMDIKRIFDDEFEN